MTYKPHRAKTPEEIFNEAVEGESLSLGALRLLSSGFIALNEAKSKTVNDVELNALRSMLAYTAHTENVSEDTIAELVTTHFDVSQLANLPSCEYQNAIEYLVDLELKKVLN